MQITLREITKNNWRECVDLKVGPGQENFVAPNLFSIAEAKFEPGWTPLAIYAGETLVGFTMYGQDERDGSYWIIRLMVDAAYQGRGAGQGCFIGSLAIPCSLDVVLEIQDKSLSIRNDFLDDIPNRNNTDQLIVVEDR